MIETTKETSAEIFAIEDTQSQASPSVFKKLSELKGVLENELFDNQYIYFVISPSKWKSTCGVKGRKREDQKRNAQLFVKKKFGIEVSEDEADAICIGWHVVTKEVKKIRIKEL